MTGYNGLPGDLAWAALLSGLAYAAVSDLRTREAPDLAWQALGLAGAALGIVALRSEGLLAVGCWILVAALVLEHFFPWDVVLERFGEAVPGIVELAGYLAVGGILAFLTFSDGVGAAGVPPIAWAAFAVVVGARSLFELGLLYGGADAKALMAAALLIPLAPVLLFPAERGTMISQVVPGPLTLLMNAALLSLIVPVALVVRNLRDGTFEGASSFVGFTIPVRELPDRFVWLRDPLLGGSSEEERAVESTEDDRALRVRQQARLTAQGIERVWVTPQLPFLVFFLAGAAATLLFGNLLFALLSWL